MSRYFSIIIAVLLISSCQMPLVLNEEQKNADAVYISLNEEFVLDKNGEQEYINSSRMLLNTHASFNRLYADSHINYDPLYQKFEVLKAETENSMGKSVVKENAINDILPKAAQKSEYYNRLRTKVVSHMGTEIGAIINFDYKISSKSKYKPGLFENIIIGKEIPVKDYSLSVVVPEGKKLNYKLFNSDVKPVVDITEKGERYTWSFTDLSATTHDSKQPKYNKEAIRLVFSTVSKAELDAYILENIQTKYGSLLNATATKVTEGIETAADKVHRLQSEVMKNVAYCHLSLKETSYRTRTSDDIWKAAGANNLEKNIIFRDLLKSAGYQAKLLFAVPENLMEFAQTNPDVWGDPYVYIDSVYNGILMKANKVNLYSAHLDLNGLKLYDPFNGNTFTMLKGKNSLNGKINLNINSRKTVWGDAEIECSGVCNQKLKNVDEHYIKSQISYAMNYKERGDKYVYYLQGNSSRVSDKYFSIKLPVFGTGFKSFTLPALKERRNNTLEIKGSIDESYSYTLGCSDKFTMVNKLKNIKKENALGKVVFNVKKEEGKWIIEKRLLIKKALISPNEYGMFKELVEIWEDKNINRLYFTNTN